MDIYVDIDNTICKTTDMGYDKAVPIQTNIKKVNDMYDRGNKITMWTARGTKTGIDWRELTEKQLDEWGVKYHSLKFGKPAFDILIDDKCINSIWDWSITPEKLFQDNHNIGRVFLTKENFSSEKKLIQKYMDDELSKIKSKKVFFNTKYRKQIADFCKNNHIFKIAQTKSPNDCFINFKNIACIGNGRTLLCENYGKDIDNHQFVFRMNTCKLIKTENTGKKNNFHFLNECATMQYIFKIYTSNPDYIVLVAPHIYGYRSLFMIYCYILEKYPKQKVFIMKPSFREKICKIVNHNSPSTGYNTIMCARELSKNVSVYGIRLDSKDNTHYYDNTKIGDIFHNINKEYEYYKTTDINFNYSDLKKDISVYIPFVKTKRSRLMRKGFRR